MNARRTTCRQHTPCPDGYIAWHEWAERKSRRHYQVRCDECGLFAIWRRRAGGTVDEAGAAALSAGDEEERS